MKFAVNQLKRSTYNEPFLFDDQVDVSELETMNNDIRRIGSVHVFGKCVLQEEDLVFSFTVKGEMILPCARTLVDVPYPFEIRADEVFTLAEYYGKEEAEYEIHPIDGEVLDLVPYIKENIVLEVPFRVFSNDPDVIKNAPVSGEGWDFNSDEHKEESESVDPRLKKLASLFDDDEKNLKSEE